MPAALPQVQPETGNQVAVLLDPDGELLGGRYIGSGIGVVLVQFLA